MCVLVKLGIVLLAKLIAPNSVCQRICTLGQWVDENDRRFSNIQKCEFQYRTVDYNLRSLKLFFDDFLVKLRFFRDCCFHTTNIWNMRQDSKINEAVNVKLVRHIQIHL